MEIRHGIRTRAAENNDMVVKPNRTVVGSKAFQFVGPSLWNTIALDIRNSTTVQAFKTALISLLFATHYDDG